MTDIVTGASSSADSAFVAVTTTTSFSVARGRVIAGTSTLVPATRHVVSDGGGEAESLHGQLEVPVRQVSERVVARGPDVVDWLTGPVNWTSAPGSAAPDGSTTVPERVDV